MTSLLNNYFTCHPFMDGRKRTEQKQQQMSIRTKNQDENRLFVCLYILPLIVVFKNYYITLFVI